MATVAGGKLVSRDSQLALIDGPAIDTDVVIVGAGPVGLFQVFELGLLGIRAQVIDSLPEPGGQCIELYADKPIYDIPATKVCTGRQLIDRLLDQIRPFDARFHLGQQVDVVAHEADGHWRIETSAGTRLRATTVFIAGGVGSFQPRRLKVDGLAAYEGKQLFYSAPVASTLAGRQVLVVGDTDAALECAIELARASGAARAAHVTLMHRRDEFKAAPATIQTLRDLRAAGKLDFVAAQPIGIETSNGRLIALQVTGSDGAVRALPLDTLLVLTGLSPKLGPIAD